MKLKSYGPIAASTSSLLQFGDRSCSRAVKLISIIGLGLLVANCGNGQRADIDPKYGVRPSPRVVAQGQEIPKGGGFEKIGKPYVVAGKLYTPRDMTNYSAKGLASWYGDEFHGRKTANGEVFDYGSVTAAHPTMPLPSYIRVTNLENGRSIVARVNDRGPYHQNRLIDVSARVAEALNFKRKGIANVKVDYLGRASVDGSDDAILMASLQTDGRPATLTGNTAPVQVASNTSDFITDLFADTPEPQANKQEEPLVLASASSSESPVLDGIPLPPVRPLMNWAPARLEVAQKAVLGTPSLASGAFASAAAVPVPLPRPSDQAY